MGLLPGKPRPVFRENVNKSPAHPLGRRVLARQLPIQAESEGGIIKPENAKERAFSGYLIAAGDQAADVLYDADIRLGDEVWFAKYGGLIEEWQHMATRGDGSCRHEGVWDHVSKGNSIGSPPDPRWAKVRVTPDNDTTLHACRACGALKLTERVIALEVDDVLCSVDAQERLEKGVTWRERRETEDGRTRYVIVREKGFVDTFETRKVAV